MAKTHDQTELHNALTRVRLDAKSQIEWHTKRLNDTPFGGSWTQEKHDKYHNDAIKEAQLVLNWCMVRQMQIDPD